MVKATPPAGPTLTSLPKDVISHITSYLDSTSFVTFARVSKYCHLFLDASIWRELNLSLSPYFGRRPLIEPCTPEQDRHAYRQWYLARAMVEEEAYGMGLRDKVKRMLSSGDEGKWSKVLKVRLDPRPAAVLPALQLLDFASSSLLTLHIEASDTEWPRPWHLPYPYETLDHALIGSLTTFPSLTHLHMGSGSNCTGGLILLLCGMSPNLTSAIFNLDRYRVKGFDGPPKMPFPPFTGTTRIRGLRLMWELISADEDDDELEAFLSLIKASPDLSQLSLGFADEDSNTMGDLLSALRDHPNLQDLHLDWSSVERDLFLDLNPAGYRNLRRLVITSSHWWQDVFTALPRFEHIQSLYLALVGDQMPVPTRPARTPPSAQPMLPSFAAGVRACRELHHIFTVDKNIDSQDLAIFERLDEIDANDSPSAIISSYRHAESEVIHVRMLLAMSEVMEYAGEIQESKLSGSASSVTYADLDGVIRTKVFIGTDHAAWQNFTDWDGLLVPLEVLEKMRETEGVCEEDWSKRGVEVGEACWKVLTGWRDGVV